jgi:hypothetical protein
LFKDYSEENSIIVIKVQFLALEIARNREGFNDDIRDASWSSSFLVERYYFLSSKCLVANATPLIFILFNRLVLIRVHFTYSNFAWGLHDGVDVKWSGGLLVLELH